MKCRFIIMMETERYSTLEDAIDQKDWVEQLCWDELCDVMDDTPKILSISEVKE